MNPSYIILKVILVIVDVIVMRSSDAGYCQTCAVYCRRVITCYNSSLSNLRALLPSRCNLGEKFCEGTCQATGRVGGKCTVDEDGAKDCQCNETFLSASQFALCAAESTCRLDCQRQG